MCTTTTSKPNYDFVGNLTVVHQHYLPYNALFLQIPKVSMTFQLSTSQGFIWYILPQQRDQLMSAHTRHKSCSCSITGE